jgi:hypothetical protein
MTIFNQATLVNPHAAEEQHQQTLEGTLEPRTLTTTVEPKLKPKPKSKSKSISKFESEFGTVNELDGCFHIYLDVGSNVGIQVRKLFEPNLYPDASVLKVFDSYFGPTNADGTRNETVCAIGFEPNPRHSPALKEIESAHRTCGWRTHFYTEVAAAHDYGSIDFLSDADFEHREWGGSIVPDQRKHKVTYFLKKFKKNIIFTKKNPQILSSRFDIK